MPEEQRTDLVSYCLSSLLALLGLLFIVMGQTEASQCSTEITDVVETYLEVLRGMKTLESTLLYTPNLKSYEKDEEHCMQCELHRELPVMDFLISLQQILQVMNSRDKFTNIPIFWRLKPAA
ncbi:hypothetical protein Z043_117546 [Scleropages formosus]|uniref:Interleukin n=1 Tax=Scleropages formosus TaxID=113540 RepID=A0A0P7TSG2_SCLFO|nr:hypothetical protein Z043_117546 [Scleropages formosus]